MIAISQKKRPRTGKPAWHTRFLEFEPKIRDYARHAFRNWRPGDREDLVGEVVANALVAYARLVELGKEELAYPTVLARHGIAQVRYGRRVGGSLNGRDVLSRYAQCKQGFYVQRLDQQNHDTGEWAEALVEDRRTPVPDQAAFRLDFPRWLGMQTNRDRRVAEALAVGERTKDVAKQFDISPGRISQLRRELHESWQTFHGEQVD